MTTLHLDMKLVLSSMTAKSSLLAASGNNRVRLLPVIVPAALTV
jgi:hypothetical protein